MIIGVGHMNLPCPTGPIAIVKLELGYAQIISIDHHGAGRTCMFALAPPLTLAMHVRSLQG